MEENTHFVAHLYKASKDKDGEATVIFKVPVTDALKALSIPTGRVFNVVLVNQKEEEVCQ